jgi:hypothetical protein
MPLPSPLECRGGEIHIWLAHSFIEALQMGSCIFPIGIIYTASRQQTTSGGSDQSKFRPVEISTKTSRNSDWFRSKRSKIDRNHSDWFRSKRSIRLVSVETVENRPKPLRLVMVETVEKSTGFRPDRPSLVVNYLAVKLQDINTQTPAADLVMVFLI